MTVESLDDFFALRLDVPEFVMQRNIVPACDVVIASSFFSADNAEHFGFAPASCVQRVPDASCVVMARFRDGGIERLLADCRRHPSCEYVLVQTLIGDDGCVDEAVTSRIPRNVRAVFSKNVAVAHPRVVAMPIGLDWRAVDEQVRSGYRRASSPRTVYVNLSVDTGPGRPVVVDHFRQVGWSTTRVSMEYGRNRLSYRAYLAEMATHGFCASPEGKALDQYRTWDALFAKTIPLIDANAHTRHWSALPVVFVDDWRAVDSTFLADCMDDLRTRRFDLRQLTASYWRSRIRSALVEDVSV